MTITIFEADATNETRVDAQLDGYAELTAYAQAEGLDESAITFFEPFISTDRGMEYRAYLAGSIFPAAVAKVFVKG